VNPNTRHFRVNRRNDALKCPGNIIETPVVLGNPVHVRTVDQIHGWVLRRDEGHYDIDAGHEDEWRSRQAKGGIAVELNLASSGLVERQGAPDDLKKADEDLGDVVRIGKARLFVACPRLADSRSRSIGINTSSSSTGTIRFKWCIGRELNEVVVLRHHTAAVYLAAMRHHAKAVTDKGPLSPKGRPGLVEPAQGIGFVHDGAKSTCPCRSFQLVGRKGGAGQKASESPKRPGAREEEGAGDGKHGFRP